MNKNILTFNEWALIGKDEGMEIGHAASVSHMLKLIFKKYKQENFSVIDLGCGNGWVVRKMKENLLVLKMIKISSAILFILQEKICLSFSSDVSPTLSSRKIPHTISSQHLVSVSHLIGNS